MKTENIKKLNQNIYENYNSISMILINIIVNKIKY